MKIIGLDLATLTGVCVGRGDETPRLFHFKFQKGSHTQTVFLDACRKIEALVIAEKPDMLVYEAAILAGNPITTTLVLQGLIAVVEMICDKHQIDCSKITPVEVKVALSLHGKAQKQHQEAAARLLGFSPANPDEADALGVWLHAMRATRHPSYARWRSLQETIPFQNLINQILRDAAVKKANRKPKSEGKTKNGKRKKAKPDPNPGLF